jgi:hypothetical protein
VVEVVEVVVAEAMTVVISISFLHDSSKQASTKEEEEELV